MDNNVQQPVQPAEGKNPMAVASLVLGIVSCVFSFCGVWLALIGLVGGVIAIVLAVKGRKIQAKKGMATAGLILGIIGTVLCGLLFACGLCALAALGSAVSSLDAMYY